MGARRPRAHAVHAGLVAAVVAIVPGILGMHALSLWPDHHGPESGTTGASGQDEVATPERCCGRHELRNVVHEVTTGADGNLWLTTSERRDAAVIADLAGEALEPRAVELRRSHGETFACVTGDGRWSGHVEFLDRDERGRASYLHTGRAAPPV